MSYVVDYGYKIRTMSEKQMMRYYKRHIDKVDYPTYDDWKWDMMRTGLVSVIYK